MIKVIAVIVLSGGGTRLETEWARALPGSNPGNSVGGLAARGRFRDLIARGRRGHSPVFPVVGKRSYEP